MTWTPHASRCRRKQLEQLGERGVVGDDVDRPAALGDAAATASLLPTWPSDEDQAARRRPPDVLDLRRASAWTTRATGLVGATRREAHELDEVAGVLAVGREGQAPDPRVVRAAARARARSSRSTSAASSATGGSPPGEPVPITAARRAPAARGRRASRARAPGTPTTAARLDDRAGRGRPARRRCGASRPLRRWRHRRRRPPPSLVRPSRPAPSWPACGARFDGFSVPTSVSLSSPRMNASTRSCAMSSWIWSGGLFMK